MIGRATLVHSTLTAMRLFYALGLGVLLTTSASAQRLQDQVPLHSLELAVTGSPDITARIYNYTPDLPAVYFPADTSKTLYVSTTLFQRVEAGGDTVGTGTPIVGAGVTAPAVAALRADGSFSESCTPEESANLADFAGRIVLIVELAEPNPSYCFTYVKFQIAEAAGAVAVVIHRIFRRTDPDPRTVNTYIGGSPPAGQPNIGIPGTYVPVGISAPILDALRAGDPVTLQLRDRRSVSTTAGPTPSAAALAVTGANPFAASTTLRLTTGRAETVRVDVFNALGRRVATLLDGVVSGERALTLSSAGLAPGVYVVRATGETVRARQTVTVIR